MKFRKTIVKVSLSLFFLTLAVNCKKNPISCLTGSWAVEISSELEAYSEALTNYTEDPTVENCNTYKSAASNYINALEDVGSCYGNITGYNNELKDTKKALDEIDCSEN